ACSFLVVDGVIPGNEGRGYVLRRIIRRAIRHGYKLGCRKPFFNQLVPNLVEEMGQAYPELSKAASQVQSILKAEEERFFETIENGMSILDQALAELGKGQQLAGDVAFKLHDTYGFPLDLTADVCREREMSVDEAAFDAAMEQQKNQARSAGKFKSGEELKYDGVQTDFQGYDHLALDQAQVTALYVEGSSVQRIQAGQQAVVVLNQTPFYAESGGQVGDQGILVTGAGSFQVQDTQKIQPGVFGHLGILDQGELAVGEHVAPQVDREMRSRTIRNHSATHLMHKALREVLGGHVSQKGSLVDAGKTRFDFTHHSPMTDEQIQEVERRVNLEVLVNQPTQARIMDIEAAKDSGAVMLFGEKYGDTVRVLDIGSSRELCGGTHVDRTGDIGLFKITSESGVAAGIRRLEATTGLGALEYSQSLQHQLGAVASSLRVPASEAAQKISLLLDQQRAMEKELARLKSKLASSQGDDLAGAAVDVKGVKVLAAFMDGAAVPQLREAADKLRDKLGTAALVLATASEGKVSLIAAVSKDLTSKVKAGELVNFVAQQVGGKGGGRPDMAQAGGSQPENVEQALRSVTAWVDEKLG
ncbi:MAG: alanine--tRNA ligase, partial [Limnobacter sp.]|nr:alanine--tRNA ligase [Limnobacter sp.]